MLLSHCCFFKNMNYSEFCKHLISVQDRILRVWGKQYDAIVSFHEIFKMSRNKVRENISHIFIFIWLVNKAIRHELLDEYNEAYMSKVSRLSAIFLTLSDCDRIFSLVPINTHEMLASMSIHLWWNHYSTTK
jgi:hypothetical protein